MTTVLAILGLALGLDDWHKKGAASTPSSSIALQSDFSATGTDEAWVFW